MAGLEGRGRVSLALVGRDSSLGFYAQRLEGRPAPVLLLGAGDGQFAVELAARGHEVTAVDPSEAMLEVAEERRAQRPELSARIKFHHADLRSLRLGKKFASVLAPHNALALAQSLQDLEATLETVRHHLEPDGLFVFDVVHPPPFDGEDEEAESPQPPFALEPERPVFVPHLRERRKKPGEAQGSIRRLKVRPFTPREIERALAAAGLQATEAYGGFDEKPFEPKGERQVVIAGPKR